MDDFCSELVLYVLNCIKEGAQKTLTNMLRNSSNIRLLLGNFKVSLSYTDDEENKVLHVTIVQK